MGAVREKNKKRNRILAILLILLICFVSGRVMLNRADRNGASEVVNGKLLGEKDGRLETEELLADIEDGMVPTAELPDMEAIKGGRTDVLIAAKLRDEEPQVVSRQVNEEKAAVSDENSQPVVIDDEETPLNEAPDLNIPAADTETADTGNRGSGSGSRSGNDEGVKPDQPIEPTEPEQPSKPTEPEQPSKPTEPDQSSEPTEPDQPSEPMEPEQPSKPTEPEQPSKPTEPDQPIEPTEPDQPIEPTEPDQPSEPTEPDQPDADKYTDNTDETLKRAIKLVEGYNECTNYGERKAYIQQFAPGMNVAGNDGLRAAFESLDERFALSLEEEFAGAHDLEIWPYFAGYDAGGADGKAFVVLYAKPVRETKWRAQMLYVDGAWYEYTVTDKYGRCQYFNVADFRKMTSYEISRIVEEDGWVVAGTKPEELKIKSISDLVVKSKDDEVEEQVR